MLTIGHPKISKNCAEDDGKAYFNQYLIYQELCNMVVIGTQTVFTKDWMVAVGTCDYTSIHSLINVCVHHT